MYPQMHNQQMHNQQMHNQQMHNQQMHNQQMHNSQIMMPAPNRNQHFDPRSLGQLGPREMAMAIGAQNKLINEYNKFNNSNTNSHINNLFNSNPLLANNPQIQARKETMWEAIDKTKQVEQVRHFHKANDKKQLDDKKLLEYIILQPLNVNKKVIKNDDIAPRFNFVKSTWKDDAKKMHADRDNKPYKIIAKDKYEKSVAGLEEIIKKIVNKKNDELKLKEALEKNKKDIETVVTISKVTQADKDKKRLTADVKNENKQRKELDGHHKIIYSKDKKLEHTNKFNREHRFIYTISNDSKDHSELREDRIEYYESMQKKMDEGKQIRDEIFQKLRDENFFQEEDAKDSSRIVALEPTEIKTLRDGLEKSAKELSASALESALSYPEEEPIDKKTKNTSKYNDMFEEDLHSEPAVIGKSSSKNIAIADTIPSPKKIIPAAKLEIKSSSKIDDTTKPKKKSLSEILNAYGDKKAKPVSATSKGKDLDQKILTDVLPNQPNKNQAKPFTVPPAPQKKSAYIIVNKAQAKPIVMRQITQNTPRLENKTSEKILPKSTYNPMDIKGMPPSKPKENINSKKIKVSENDEDIIL